MNRTGLRMLLGFVWMMSVGLASEAVADGPPVSIVGTWAAQIPTPGGADRLVFYTFQPNGAIQETDFSLLGQPLGVGRGSFGVFNNRVRIGWSPTSTEDAVVQLANADTMRYQIVGHSGDPAQVGTSVVFYRITPQLIEAARRQAYGAPVNPPSANGGFPWSYDIPQYQAYQERARHRELYGNPYFQRPNGQNMMPEEVWTRHVINSFKNHWR